MSNKTIKNLMLKYKNILKNAKIKTYSLDCEVLLMYVTNFDRLKLYLNNNYELSYKQFVLFENCIKRRLKKEPISYIIENCEFMGINFFVNNKVLIPRPDTELIVEKAIKIIKKNNLKNILDIGTGSGAISISISKYCDNVFVTAIDISSDAILIAKKNATKNNVINKINFIKSNLFENLNCFNFDMIISNPPYIQTNKISYLEDNVKNFEPFIALDGKEDGLYFYNEITKNAHKYLNKNSILIFEIGYDQANSVKNILNNNNFKDIQVFKDLNNLDRCILGKLY